MSFYFSLAAVFVFVLECKMLRVRGINPPVFLTFEIQIEETICPFFVVDADKKCRERERERKNE